MCREKYERHYFHSFRLKIVDKDKKMLENCFNPVFVHATGEHISLTDIPAPNEFSEQCSLANQTKETLYGLKILCRRSPSQAFLNLNAALK